MTIEMREYRVDVDGRLRDLRGHPAASPLLDADSYAASQSFGKVERKAGGEGIAYTSVRDPGGACVGLLRTGPLRPPGRQGGHYGYLWDGRRITYVIQLSDPSIRPHPERVFTK